eukprot:symbB.v1.2.024655.t1/scaffold2352.1/size103767/1
MASIKPRIRKRAWKRQIRPGKPVQLPRLLDSALRLTSVIMDGGSDDTLEAKEAWG